MMPDHQHPMSRDWAMDSISCKREACITNVGMACMTPSRCVIGEDGKCEGFLVETKPKGPEVETW